MVVGGAAPQPPSGQESERLHVHSLLFILLLIEGLTNFLPLKAKAELDSPELESWHSKFLLHGPNPSNAAPAFKRQSPTSLRDFTAKTLAQCTVGRGLAKKLFGEIERKGIRLPNRCLLLISILEIVPGILEINHEANRAFLLHMPHHATKNRKSVAVSK